MKGDRKKAIGRNIERKFDLLTYDEVDYAGLKDAVSGGMSNEQAFISYVGRFNYDYKGRYLLELGFRNDGSYAMLLVADGLFSLWGLLVGVCRKRSF